ncbi:hypothetical protein EDD21DRAFT_364715, partial [Dissophora ornata]
MVAISKKKTPTSTAARLFSAVATIACLSMGMVEATINCQSPTGTHQVGDSVTLSLGDNGWWPKASDIYSVTATVRCSSGGSQLASFATSNGGSWTIPSSAYGSCSSNQIYVEYTGTAYDLLHLLHPWGYTATCGSMTITEPPPPATTTTTTTTQAPATTEPAATTNPPQATTTVPPKSTSDPTQTTPVQGGTTATSVYTTTASPVYTTTYTVVPTVISGKTTMISVTTFILVNATASVTTASGSDPSSTQLPGLSPSSGQNQTQKSNTNVPVAALSAVGGAAALALIVFGLVMTRKRKRRREEQLDHEDLGPVLEKSDYVYGAGMGNSADNLSLPSLHQAGSYSYAAAAAAAATSGAGIADYGAPSMRISDQSNESFGNAAAIGGNTEASLLPFPVPSATSDALKQQYALANRMSAASQESLSGGLGGAAAAGGATSSAGAVAAAAAVNHQMSLKQMFDEEDGDESYAPRSSPSHAYLSAPSISASVSAVGAGIGSYSDEHAATSSSAYDTAFSPTMSAASWKTQDIILPPIPTSDWRTDEAGRTESSHIRDLIRNVLDDD